MGKGSFSPNQYLLQEDPLNFSPWLTGLFPFFHVEQGGLPMLIRVSPN